MRRAVKSLIVAALLVAACNNKPTGFGVDVEARTNMLSSATRNAIVSARLYVSGAETFSTTIAGVGKAAQSGAMKFRYVPAVHAGMLALFVEGVDAGGKTLAGGSTSVTLADGKAVDAVVTLATNGNGVACMAPTDCMSGNCADGVCCDKPCDGVCQSCNLPGSIGACTPAPMGMDPRQDCAAKIPMGGDDGGTGGPLDGGVTGVTVDPTMCSGTCNGRGACTYPGTTTSCSGTFCSDVAKTGAFFCDGNGSCVETDSMCTDYVCFAGACKSMCNSNPDCQSPDFCNLNINKCVPKHDLGTSCGNAFECKSGFCTNGVCCDSVCNNTGQSCNNAGTMGHCQCTGVTCDSGVSCVLFYKDGDSDTFGDVNGTITNGNAKAGCASGTNSTPPAGFVANNSDCDDKDAQAHPGQTAFFATPSMGTGSFDYNCDGTIEKETYENQGGTCGFCNARFPICGSTNACTTAGDQANYGCFYFRFCHIGTTLAFVNGPVGCGNIAQAQQCGTCSVAGGPPNNSFPSVQQRCK